MSLIFTSSSVTRDGRKPRCFPALFYFPRKYLAIFFFKLARFLVETAIFKRNIYNIYIYRCARDGGEIARSIVSRVRTKSKAVESEKRDLCGNLSANEGEEKEEQKKKQKGRMCRKTVSNSFFLLLLLHLFSFPSPFSATLFSLLSAQYRPSRY